MKVRTSKVKATLACLAVGISFCSGAFAKEPCGTELCLGGMVMMGEEPEKCKKPIEDFFEIVKYKNGHPSPSKTLNARKKFLYGCDSGDDNKKDRILAKYGMVIR